MALSNKPPRSTKAKKVEKKIDEIINRGGGVPSEQITAKPKKEKKIPVQLRLTKSMIEEIDQLIDEKHYPFSRHTWFLLAIQDRINKEKEG